VAKPVKHRGKWRIRWVDEHEKRQSAVFDDYKRAQTELSRRQVEVEEIKVSVRRIAFLTSEGHSRRCSRGGQDGTVDTRGMGGASRAVEEQWADSRGVRV
jgi:hypothetical protein